MSCDIGKCTYSRSCEIALIAIDQNDDIFNHMGEAKRRELNITKQLFAIVSSTDCPGLTEEGKCGSAMVVSEARNMLFSVPGMHINSTLQNERTVGFNVRGDV